VDDKLHDLSLDLVCKGRRAPSEGKAFLRTKRRKKKWAREKWFKPDRRFNPGRREGRGRGTACGGLGRKKIDSRVRKNCLRQ